MQWLLDEGVGREDGRCVLSGRRRQQVHHVRAVTTASRRAGEGSAGGQHLVVGRDKRQPGQSGSLLLLHNFPRVCDGVSDLLEE